MLRDYLDHYYNLIGTNCAETMLHAANDAWNLELDPTVFKAVGGFGGGCGCGNLCGAIAGGLAAMGYLYIEGPTAHRCPTMQAKSGMLVERVIERLGSERCDVLHPRYRTDAEHCLPTIRLIADILEEVREAELPPSGD